MLSAVLLSALFVGDSLENQVARILADHDAAVRALDAERRNPRAKSAKIQALTKKARADAFAGRILAAVKSAPESQAAFKGLAWILKNQGGVDLTRAQTEAADLLTRHHLSDAGLQRLCSDLSNSRSAAAEKLLRAVLVKGSSREVRGGACIALARFLECSAAWADYCQYADRRERAMMEATPEGKSLLQWAADLDASGMRSEAESLNQRVRKEFADLVPKPAGGVAPPMGGPPIGKPAPEIVGEDLDGQRMKLADYRGKVVVIEFWAWRCVYCRALVPADESLRSGMHGRPFALLGVNADGDVSAAKKEAGEAGLPWPSWPSWRDGAEIAKRWGILRWPTTIVIDHKGVVRHVGLTGKALAEAVEKLVKEVPPTQSK